ncbi:MAG TPA: ABC transporter permease [Devosia sp.]|nr:ABC transporter permease [Devosia sp.]
MGGHVNDIPAANLAMLLLLAAPVVVMLFVWKLHAGKALYALFRMLAQLLAVGYVLAFIFEAESAWLVLLVLSVMVGAAAWISLNPLKSPVWRLYLFAFIAILLSGSLTLLVVTRGVLRIAPWYSPRLLIPLAGMIFSNSMTAVSLSSERMVSELSRGSDFAAARATAFNAALIPAINAMFAVGLVSLPGMMTGQILSGVSPLIAVKYQIVVMVMVFSAAGLSNAIFLHLSRHAFCHHVAPVPGAQPGE